MRMDKAYISLRIFSVYRFILQYQMILLLHNKYIKGRIYLVDFSGIFAREATVVTVWFLFCTPKLVCKRLYSIKKEFAPNKASSFVPNESNFFFFLQYINLQESKFFSEGSK